MDVASRKNIPIFILIFNSHYSDLLNEVHNGICQKPQRLCLLVGYFSARCNKKNHNFQMPNVARGISKSHFDWDFFKVLKIRLLFKVPNQALWDWRVFSLVLLHFLSIYRNFVWYESARGHSNNREVRKVTFSIEKFCQRGTLWQMVKIIPHFSILHLYWSY